MLPPDLPLFPLPATVLFPNVFLPLHIFEARYRAMVADALAGDRMIGMTLLKPGHEADYEGTPPVYPIGCAGVITHSEQLEDGRYNIVLRGIERFRIEDETVGLAYRRARITPLPEPLDQEMRDVLRRQRQRLEAVLIAAIERSGAEPRFPPSMPDDDLVNALSQYLQFEPVERQALLERQGAVDRCQGLIELLQMKIMAPPGIWDSGATH